MLKLVELEEKDADEIIPYAFNLKKYTAFSGTGAEVIASVAWAVALSTDDAASYTDIPSMRYASSYSNTTKVVQCDIQGGTEGKAYILRGVVTCSSGRKYLVAGKFKVKEL